MVDGIICKNKLKQWCERTIEQRIAAAREMMQQAQESANAEEKSSAGDKYETGRAMGHLQKDMHERQLAGHIKELSDLRAVNSGELYTVAGAGALIKTDSVSIFIAAGLGKQAIDGETILFISPFAPMAISLQGKKTGDSFLFSGQQIVIKDIC